MNCSPRRLATIVCLTALLCSVEDRAAEAAQPTEGLKQAQLLLELPDYCNTPDGMCLLPDGNIILSVPNVNDMTSPPVLMKITPEDKAELFYRVPPHPESGHAGPLGICVTPDGDLLLADCQIFFGEEGGALLEKSRILRIKLANGKPVETTTFASGMNVANAIVIRDGWVYTTDTVLVPGSDPLISGVFRFPLDGTDIQVTSPPKDDPHVLPGSLIETYNLEVGFGADGLTFDPQGNLYIGNFADGTLHKLEFDDAGNVTSNTVFAKSEKMRCADGIFYHEPTNKIYVADSLSNAVQMVSLDGTVETLAIAPDNDGSTGDLDQPCEVLVRGNEVIVSNMDFPVPGGVNTTFDKPYTMSKIPLD